MEPEAFCRAALERIDDWAADADRAAIAVLLGHFIRSRPSAPLFAESLRALARDTSNGSLSRAALAIRDRWRSGLETGPREEPPVRPRTEDAAPAPPPTPRPAAAPAADTRRPSDRGWR